MTRLTRITISLFLLIILAPQVRKTNSASQSPNSPPVASDDSYTRHGDGTIGPVLANDFDPDGDRMTASAVTFPLHGSLSGLDGNSFYYTLSDTTFVGTDSFTY